MAKKTSTQTLRSFYAKGKRANLKGEQRKRKKGTVWGTLELLGAETASSKNRLMEARKFARLCDKKELDFLCRLGGDDWKLTPTHVLQLLRLAELKDRQRLAKQCAQHTWSVQELQRAVDRLMGRRTYGGRRYKSPPTVDAALRVTQRLARSFCHWGSVLQSKRGQGAAPTMLDKLPDTVRRALTKTLNDAERLTSAIDQELQSNGRAKSRRRKGTVHR